MTEPIPFRGFDERADVRIYQHGDLPHWRQDGCTYFVTFRQADSLPTSVVREMEADRQNWLRRHSINPESYDWKSQFARLSADKRREYERSPGITLDRHLDTGDGSCVLQQCRFASVVAEALLHFHGSRVLAGDFVITPNHVHALVRPLDGFELEDILHSIKGYTARRINQLTEGSGAFWQRQSYDHIVRDYVQLEAMQQYIALNPVKAGLQADQYILHQTTWIPEI
jgi:REP element-mobilizing transposase RayT